METMIIRVDSESQFKIKIEKIEEFNTSLFRSAYFKASENIKEIMENNKNYYKVKRESENKFEHKEKEEKNNIIAFAGERGAGKTSAMMSFANALGSRKKCEFDGFKEFADKEFWVLDTIDPSLFEKKESIFQVVIAKLFEEFKSTIKNNGSDCNIEKQRNILRSFEKVYKNFKGISSSNGFNESMSLDDTLETLGNLAASSGIRESFMNLVKELLLYRFGENKENIHNKFIVLPIDDLDMNISMAEVMMEEIRKYLLLPNIIIIMAVKVEQLTDSMEQMFVEEYETLIKMNRTIDDDPKNMAVRYIEKLIPNGRKIYLPDFKLMDNLDEIEVEFEDKKKIKGIQECILGIIYRKTGLLFIKPKIGVHYLIPDNMRELQNLMAMLIKINDLKIDAYGFIEENEVNNELLKSNLKVFENYFYYIWVKRNLKSRNIGIIYELKRMPMEHKNKFIIGKIADAKLKTVDEKGINGLKKDHFEPYCDIQNLYYNISLGDVLETLKINQDYDDEEMRNFKFAIKTVYSMEIHKRMYFQEYKDTGYEELYRLTAGNVLGENYDTVAPNEKSSWQIKRYDEMPIVVLFKERKFVFKLSDLIKILLPGKNRSNIKEELMKELSDQKELQNVLKEFTQEEIRIFWGKCMNTITLLHYFIYQGSDKSNEFRKNINYYYDVEATLGMGTISTKNAKFSLYAFITKALNLNGVLGGIFQYRLEKIKEERENLINSRITSIITEEMKMWKNRCILPINSLEALEEIFEYLNNNKYKKFKETYAEPQEYFNGILYQGYLFLLRALEAIQNKIQYIMEDSEYVEKDNEGTGIILSPFKNHEIVRKISSKDETLVANIEALIRYQWNLEEQEKNKNQKVAIEKNVEVELKKLSSDLDNKKEVALMRRWIRIGELVSQLDWNDDYVLTIVEIRDSYGDKTLMEALKEESNRINFVAQVKDLISKILEDLSKTKGE